MGPYGARVMPHRIVADGRRADRADAPAGEAVRIEQEDRALSVSATTISIFSFGEYSREYRVSRYQTLRPFAAPYSLTLLVVNPWMPTSPRAAVTSSSLPALIVASIIFIDVLAFPVDLVAPRPASVRATAGRRPAGPLAAITSRLVALSRAGAGR